MTNKTENTQSEISFEKAFSRLEEILEKMNASTASLDESLALYEEADKLINICSQRLANAERKIEILTKNRNGDPILGPDQKPATQNFQSNMPPPQPK